MAGTNGTNNGLRGAMLLDAQYVQQKAEIVEANNRLARASLESQWLQRFMDPRSGAGGGRGRRMAFAGSYGTTPTRVRDGNRGGGRPRGGSPDGHLDDNSLAAIRQASQQMARENPIARAITTRLGDVIVGDGPTCRAKTGDKEWNAKADALFNAWWDRLDGTGIDIRGLCTGAEITRQLVDGAAIDGDILVVRVDSTPQGSLQLVEADRIVPPGSGAGAAVSRFVGGVELDSVGRPVTFHLGNYGPTGYRPAVATERVPASQCWHLACPIRRRANLTRGEPVLAGVLDRLEQLDGYLEAVEIAVRMAACFAVFVKVENPAITQGLWAGSTVSTGTDRTTSGTIRETDVEPGTLNFLNPGESIEQTKPEQPGGSHDQYVWSQVQIISADVGLPLVLTMLDFSKVNMSAAKSAVVMAWLNVLRWQDWLRAHFLQPVRLWWTFRAMNAGLIPYHPEWQRHEWTQNPPAVLDPLSEIQAESLAIDKGLRTRAESLRRLSGADLEEFLQERAAEIKRENELGVVTLTTPGQKPAGEMAGTSRAEEKTDAA